MLRFIQLTLAALCLSYALSGPAYERTWRINDDFPVRGQPGQTYRLSFEDYVETWETFKDKYGKVYSSLKEEGERFEIFMKTVKTIELHNWDFHFGKEPYWMDINQFADLEHSEIREQMGSGLKRQGATFQTSCDDYTVTTGQVPDSVDWRQHGYVTPVKDQKQCGSCWSFSSTGSIEGQWFKKTGNLVPLSEQQLMDCSTDFGNNGCHGGFMDNAFLYLIDEHVGLESEEDYPYLMKKEKTCHLNKDKVVAEVTGCKDVKRGDEEALKVAIANIGPISVGMDASHPSIVNYRGGIYHDKNCSNVHLDHGVLAVGYGTDEVTGWDYWLIKNSWSRDWGVDGYLKVLRNHNNTCGIASLPSFPVV